MYDISELTVDDFTNSGWDHIISTARFQDCSEFSGLFAAESGKAKAAGNNKLSLLFRFLQDLTSIMLKSSDSAEPFAPMAVFGDRRSAMLSDFNASHLDYLSAILPHVSSPELNARFCDFLWIGKRDHKMAEEAIRQYLEAASQLLTDETWPIGTDRIERANELSYRFRRPDLVDLVVDFIEQELSIDRVSDGIPSFLPAKLMLLLLGGKRGDPQKYGALAERLAAAAEGSGDWYRAREFWDIAYKWHTMAQSAEKIEAAKIRVAEAFVSEAQAAISRNPPIYTLASHWIECAIQAYRKLAGQDNRIDQLHKILIEYQRMSRSEMKAVSEKIDAGEIIASAESAVKGQSKIDALLSLATIARLPKVSYLKHQAMEQNKRYIASQLCARTFVNEMGRTVAREAAVRPGDEDDQNLRIDMNRNASIERSITAQACIEPARELINMEHDVRLADFHNLASNNPFVPAGREYSFAKGLYGNYSG